MKLSLRVRGTNAPEQTGNYDVFERGVSAAEGFEFLSRLVSDQDIIHLEEPHGSVDFWKHEDSLWMELYTDALWATSEVNEVEGKALIDMLAQEESFGYCIPITTREWDAYAPLDDALFQQSAT